MQKLGTARKTLIILGAIVAIMPFLGFPTAWKDVIYIVLGTTVAVVTVLSAVSPHVLKRDRGQKEDPEEVLDVEEEMFDDEVDQEESSLEEEVQENKFSKEDEEDERK